MGTGSHHVAFRDNSLNPDKEADCKLAVECLFTCMRNNIRSGDIMTKAAFQNAIATVYAIGGSTNAVLHILAMAAEMQVELDIQEFQTIGQEIPLILNLSPHGPYQMVDLNNLGGIPVVM